jgi:hypothetical protein
LETLRHRGAVYPAESKEAVAGTPLRAVLRY